MNTYEQGKKLSRIVTGTIALLAVISASLIGVRIWTDTTAARADSPSISTTGGAPAGSETTHSKVAPAAPITPGRGKSTHATTSGS
jgi:hypothetical protein